MTSQGASAGIILVEPRLERSKFIESEVLMGCAEDEDFQLKKDHKVLLYVNSSPDTDPRSYRETPRTC